jgi:hypothetical protein
MSLALALAWALVAMGCSDDSNPPPDWGTNPDYDGPAMHDGAEPPQEGGVQDDGSGVEPDQSAPQVCEPACQQESRTLCVTDPASGGCVACTEDRHCAAMPDVDGPYCDTSTMECVECLDSNHCANHPGGAVCEGNACHCTTDADCSGSDRFGPSCVQLPAYSRCGCEDDAACSGSTLGSKCFVDLNHKCVCYEQADCAGNGEKTACQLPYYYADYGHCAAPCTSHAECQLEQLERCDSSSGVCVECTEDAHCANVERGHKCLANRCSCEDNNDCPQGLECLDLFGSVECREP